MKRKGFYVTCVSALLVTSWVSGEDDDPAATIPLDRIWAYNMPGTKSVRELEPQHNYDQLPSQEQLLRDSSIARIQHALLDRPAEGELAGPAYLVTGTGKQALEKVADIVTKKIEPTQVLSADTDLTAVFYSYRCGQYVWIDSVKKTNNQITIRYRFVAHRTRESTTHFALIPLGKLPVGTFHVEIEELPPATLNDDPTTPIQDPQRIVCDSFSCQIGE
jgi:hypothetical protein